MGLHHRRENWRSACPTNRRSGRGLKELLRRLDLFFAPLSPLEHFEGLSASCYHDSAGAPLGVTAAASALRWLVCVSAGTGLVIAVCRTIERMRQFVPIPHPDYPLGTAVAVDPVVAVAMRLRDISHVSSCSVVWMQARYVTPKFLWWSGSHQGGKRRRDPLSPELRRVRLELHRRGGPVLAGPAVDRERVTVGPWCRRNVEPRRGARRA